MTQCRRARIPDGKKQEVIRLERVARPDPRR